MSEKEKILRKSDSKQNLYAGKNQNSYKNLKNSQKKPRKEKDEDSDSEAEKKKLRKNRSRRELNSDDSDNDDLNGSEDTVSESSEKQQQRLWKKIPSFGLFLVFLSVLISNMTNIIIKEFTGIEPPVLLLYRSIIMFSISMPWAVMKNVPPFPPGMKNKDRLLLIFRGVISCINIIASYYSVRYMNLGDQKMLTATRPVFVAISARIFLKEPCGIFEMISMLFMLVGIVFVVKPPVLFGGDSPEEMYDQAALQAGIAVFVGTALSANITVILRKLRKEHVASLTAANQIMFIVESFLIVMILNFDLMTPSPMDKLKILMISLGTLATALLHLLALKIEEANKIAFMADSAGILIAFLIQGIGLIMVLYFGQIPAPHSLIGASLVTCAVLLLGVKSLWTKKLRMPSPAKKLENLFLNVTNQV